MKFKLPSKNVVPPNSDEVIETSADLKMSPGNSQAAKFMAFTKVVGANRERVAHDEAEVNWPRINSSVAHSDVDGAQVCPNRQRKARTVESSPGCRDRDRSTGPL